MENKEEKLTGILTDKEGFSTSINLPKSIKIEIDGVQYNYFINNNVERKQLIKGITKGSTIEYEIKENKGFKFIDNIRAIKLEVKEHKEVTKPTINNFRTPEQLMKNEILSALCVLYSNQEVIPTDDELVKEVSYIYKKLF